MLNTYTKKMPYAGKKLVDIFGGAASKGTKNWLSSLVGSDDSTKTKRSKNYSPQQQYFSPENNHPYDLLSPETFNRNRPSYLITPDSPYQPGWNPNNSSLNQAMNVFDTPLFRGNMKSPNSAYKTDERRQRMSPIEFDAMWEAENDFPDISLDLPPFNNRSPYPTRNRKKTSKFTPSDY